MQYQQEVYFFSQPHLTIIAGQDAEKQCRSYGKKTTKIKKQG